MAFDLSRQTILITGANRGIGKAMAEVFLDRGAKKLYLGARKTGDLEPLVKRYGGRTVPIALDVTDDAQVAQAAGRAGDVTLLINNAGVAGFNDGLQPDSLENARREMEVNYFGVLNMTRAFLPALKANRGVLVNVASVASFINFPIINTYAASKAAAHSLTVGLRGLIGEEVRVVGVYPGPIDTDMATEMPMDKAPPSSVAEALLEALANGEDEVFPDEIGRQFYEQWRTDRRAAEQQAAQPAEA